MDPADERRNPLWFAAQARCLTEMLPTIGTGAEPIARAPRKLARPHSARTENTGRGSSMIDMLNAVVQAGGHPPITQVKSLERCVVALTRERYCPRAARAHASRTLYYFVHGDRLDLCCSADACKSERGPWRISSVRFTDAQASAISAELRASTR